MLCVHICYCVIFWDSFCWIECLIFSALIWIFCLGFICIGLLVFMFWIPMIICYDDLLVNNVAIRRQDQRFTRWNTMSHYLFFAIWTNFPYEPSLKAMEPSLASNAKCRLDQRFTGWNTMSNPISFALQTNNGHSLSLKAMEKNPYKNDRHQLGRHTLLARRNDT
jgi:hypothetical protein